MEEIERKAGGGFLGVGACRRGRAAATVELPGKLINRNPPPGALNQSRRARKNDAGSGAAEIFY